MLRHFLDDFMSFVPLQMPQLLNVATMEEPQFYGDYVLLTFPLRDPYDLEEVMDIFEDDMELITLYHLCLLQSRFRTNVQDERPDRRGRQGKPRHRDRLRFVGTDVRRPVSRLETPHRKRQLQVQEGAGRRAVGFHVKQFLCETRYIAR